MQFKCKNEETPAMGVARASNIKSDQLPTEGDITMNTSTVLHSNPDSSDVSMSSVEIAEVTGKNHSHVLRDIRSMLSQLYGAYPKMDGSDIKGVFEELRQDNGQTKAFHLDREHAECLVTGYSAQLRMKVIRRLRELEEQVAKPDPMQALNDPATMRGLLLSYAEKNLEQEKRLAEQAPKVEAYDRISASSETLTITQASKVLGVKRESLTRWMAANGWIYRQNKSWVAYKAQETAGRLVYKEAKYTDDNTGMEVHKPYCHITQKGLAKLAMVFQEDAA
jgi:phage antirepressor YoqD-like protein